MRYPTTLLALLASFTAQAQLRVTPLTPAAVPAARKPRRPPSASTPPGYGSSTS